MFAILCTGPSMSQDVANSVRNLRVIAVNVAYELAPWAEAMAANDVNWWLKNPQANQFAGRKFSTNRVRGTEQIKAAGSCESYCCSGVLALESAKRMGATRILLLGADFHGTHYFGDYANGLRNTTDTSRRQHAAQFARWGKLNKGIEVLNCTPGSALTCFPMARLEDVLCNS